MTKRFREWQTRFAALLAERMAQPFEWGRNDCALFVCDCVEAITGHDPAADLRGTYSTEFGALRVIKAGGGLAEIAGARLGAEIAPTLAQVGDVGLCAHRGDEVLASWGGMTWLVPGDDGLVPLQKGSATRAWRCTGVRHG